MKNIRQYYLLTKPGIIKGNILSVVAGFFIASSGSFDLVLLLFVVLGSVFIIASGCVFNNMIDSGIDQQMLRTKTRATVTKTIKSHNVFLFGSILLLVGLALLLQKVNILTAFIGLFGFVSYVFIYAYFKRKNEYGTLVGSISGAIPPLAGYTAVKNDLDIGALLVFLVLVIWQMPHFYAISIFRIKDYKKAKIPVLSITRGINTTKKHILTYIILFLPISLLPSMFGVTNIIYFVCMLIVSLYWIYVAITRYKKDAVTWSKSIFGASLLVLLVFCFGSVADSILLGFMLL